MTAGAPRHPRPRYVEDSTFRGDARCVLAHVLCVRGALPEIRSRLTGHEVGGSQGIEAPWCKTQNSLLRDREVRCGRRSVRNPPRLLRPARARWRWCSRGSSDAISRCQRLFTVFLSVDVAKSNVIPGTRSATTRNSSQTTISPPRRPCQNSATKAGFVHATTIADTNACLELMLDSSWSGADRATADVNPAGAPPFVGESPRTGMPISRSGQPVEAST